MATDRVQSGAEEVLGSALKNNREMQANPKGVLNSSNHPSSSDSKKPNSVLTYTHTEYLTKKMKSNGPS